MSTDDIQDAIEAISRGGFVVVTDDKDRENEGDLILAAEHATEENIAFMVRHTSGLICASLKGERLDALDLPLMVKENTESHKTAFTISVDSSHGTTTGISASDRAKTLRDLADPNSQIMDFKRPGHIFPLRYCEGGVLKRAGHTEAALDLAVMAGLQACGVLCEIVNEDGSMCRGKDLQVFAEKHQLPIISIAELIRYRLRKEKLVVEESKARIPTEYGEFTAHVYSSTMNDTQHVAFVKGEIDPAKPCLVRVHSECLTGDIFSSLRCDCGSQLKMALKRINEEGSGVLVYLRGHEGRGIGLAHKLRAYNLQDQGQDTVEANLSLGLPVDSREYGVGAQILMDLGVSKMRLMTNNPSKYGGLEGFNLEIVERVPLNLPVHSENIAYLRAKKEKLGHMIDLGVQA